MINVLFAPNGVSAVFGPDGQQIPELQEPWIILFVKHLEEHGIDVLDCEFTMPNGRVARLFKTERGWNWNFA